MKETESPGPGNYSFDTEVSPIYKNYGVAIFGRATRKTTIGEVGTNDSPGPGILYPSKH